MCFSSFFVYFDDARDAPYMHRTAIKKEAGRLQIRMALSCVFEQSLARISRDVFPFSLDVAHLHVNP